MSRYRAFEGANGWYVAFENDDGFHSQPQFYRDMTYEEARKVAARKNREREYEVQS